MGVGNALDAWGKLTDGRLVLALSSAGFRSVVAAVTYTNVQVRSGSGRGVGVVAPIVGLLEQNAKAVGNARSWMEVKIRVG